MIEKFLNQLIIAGGVIPYHTQIVDATVNKFLIEDWHNFGRLLFFQSFVQLQIAYSFVLSLCFRLRLLPVGLEIFFGSLVVSYESLLFLS